MGGGKVTTRIYEVCTNFRSLDMAREYAFLACVFRQEKSPLFARGRKFQPKTPANGAWWGCLGRVVWRFWPSCYRPGGRGWPQRAGHCPLLEWRQAAFGQSAAEGWRQFKVLRAACLWPIVGSDDVPSRTWERGVFRPEVGGEGGRGWNYWRV